MTKEEITRYLDELEDRLLNQSEKIAIGLNTSWVNQFPNEATIYIFREDDAIVHVDETKDLKARMMELAKCQKFG